MTRDEILRIFRVDMESGRLWWAIRPKCHAQLFGQEAGGPRRSHSGKSYWIVRAGGKAWKRAHLVYCVMHGRFPSPCVDHINGDSLDDRIANLREATITENAWNHKKRRRPSASGLPMGLRVTRYGRFVARIGYRGKQIQIGVFATQAEAHAAYLAKRMELYGQFA